MKLTKLIWVLIRMYFKYGNRDTIFNDGGQYRYVQDVHLWSGDIAIE